MAKGYTIATGGTDNHLILWDLKPQKITGSKFQAVCDAVAITLNKNSVLGDKSAMVPGGARIGTPALTTRGLKEADFERVADFLHQAVLIAVQVRAPPPPPPSRLPSSPPPPRSQTHAYLGCRPAPTQVQTESKEGEKLVDYENRLVGRADIAALRAAVHEFASSFPMPGRTEAGSL